MKARFAGVEIELPVGWLDVSDDLPPGSPPTLAREDGIGAVQFSVAFYRSGVAPDLDEATLHAMLRARFATLSIATERSAPSIVVGGEGTLDRGTLSAWYISDGANIAFITYLADGDPSTITRELADARAIVHSLRFPPRH